MTRFEEKLRSLLTKLESFPETVDVITEIVIEEEFPKKVRSQLSEGENGRGQIIQSGYSFLWANERAKRGLQIEYVDLNYTGRFYKSLMVQKVGESYFLDSIVPYASDIFERYDNILSLQEGSLLDMRIKLKKQILNSFYNG